MSRVKTGDKELRKVFAETLEELMRGNRDIIYLEADLAGAIGTAGLFSSMPEQAFDVGIMEANMVGIGAGMSVKGKIPFMHSFGTFASRRCADQTFLSGCYNHANIKLVGSDPGITAARICLWRIWESTGAFRGLRFWMWRSLACSGKCLEVWRRNMG